MFVIGSWFVIQYVENITRWRANHAIYSRMCKTGSEGQVWGNTIIHPDALMHAYGAVRVLCAVCCVLCCVLYVCCAVLCCVLCAVCCVLCCVLCAVM